MFDGFSDPYDHMLHYNQAMTLNAENDHLLGKVFMPSTPFFHSLSLDPPATMKELYRRVDRYSMLEDNISAATQTVMITSKLAGSSKLEGKKSPEPEEG